MDVELPDWAEAAARFLTQNLRRHPDSPGWNDVALTAYQIGCDGLVKLGLADRTRYGAEPKDKPELPAILPRWDDIAVSVLWLAEQLRAISYRLPDGSTAPTYFGFGFVVKGRNTPPPPPNIQASHGLGPAFCTSDALDVLEDVGMVCDSRWTKAAEFVLWRTSPHNWKLDFQNDARFLAATQTAISSMPTEVAREIDDLVQISDAQVDELIAWHAKSIEKHREKYGPKARSGNPPTKEQALKSLEFSRANDLDWVFFRRWRIDDGWLSDTEANATVQVFHDRLAIAMRRAVLQKLHPSKPKFFQ